MDLAEIAGYFEGNSDDPIWVNGLRVYVAGDEARRRGDITVAI